MIISLLLLIPKIGSIIIAIMPVSEITETEAITIYQNKNLKTETNSKVLDISKEEIEKILKIENNNRTRNLQKVSIIFTLLNFILSI